MSTGIAPIESTIRKRTPLVSGSIVGVFGIAVKKLLKLSLSSVAGSWSLVSVSFCLLGTVGTMLVHGSHASPNGSLSLLTCEGLGMETQLSIASHTVSASVSGCPVSAGQLALEPVQVSAMSQVPAEGRHTVEDEAKPSAGQLSVRPLQRSATAQTPAEARQTAVLLASGGQPLFTPSQFSARSQTPAGARHCAVLLASAGHGWPAVPGQFSATSQMPPAGRHVRKAPLTLSAGQGSPGVPEQSSAGSHTSPEPARHTVPFGETVLGGQGWSATPVQFSS